MLLWRMLWKAEALLLGMPELKRLGVADGPHPRSPCPHLGSGGAASAGGAAFAGLPE